MRRASASALPYEVRRLKESLAESFPNDVLMPAARGTKHPMFRHRNDAWNFHKFDEFCKNFRELDDIKKLADVNELADIDYCIILCDLLVIDIDSPEQVAAFEARFGEELANAARVDTSRGRHYYFRRPALADIHGYYDGAGQREKGIDLKTVCRTGTGGIIMVPPSGGKTWYTTQKHKKYTEINFAALPEISLALLDAVAVPLHRPDTLTVKFIDSSRHESGHESGRESDHVVTLTSHLYRAMVYFEPFLEVSGDDIIEHREELCVPVPVTEGAFSSLLALLSNDYDGYCELLWNDDKQVLDTADIMGLAPQYMSRLRRLLRVGGPVHALRDLGREWPEMASAQRLASTCRTTKSELIDISSWKDVTYEPIRRPGEEDTEHMIPRIIPFIKNDRLPGSRVIVEDPLGAISMICPPQVLDLLRRHAGHLIMAGGAVTGAVVVDVMDGSDLDLFVCNTSPEQASEIVSDAEAVLGSPVVLSKNAATFVVKFGQIDKVVQIITRLYDDPAHVISCFDLPPCSVAAFYKEAGDEHLTIVCSKDFIESVRRMAFAVRLERWTRNRVYRTLKYICKGFDVYVPGMRRCALKSQCLGLCSKTTIGALFLFERSFVQRNKSILQSTRELPRPSIRHVKSFLGPFVLFSDYSENLEYNGRFIFAVKTLVRLGRKWLVPLQATNNNKTKTRSFDISNVAWSRVTPDTVVINHATPAVHLAFDIERLEKCFSGHPEIVVTMARLPDEVPDNKVSRCFLFLWYKNMSKLYHACGGYIANTVFSCTSKSKYRA